MTPRSILKAKVAQRGTIQREVSLGHHLPDVLITKVSELQHVFCRDILDNYARKYEDSSFQTLEDEYEFIRKWICDLLDVSFSNPLVEEIQNSMNASLAVSNLNKSYRNNFIHPFQVFLLGLTIFDHFHRDFQNWYSAQLCESNETSFESAWLLATIFHDRAKDVIALQNVISIETGASPKAIPGNNSFIGYISSAYQHLISGNPLGGWVKSSRKNALFSSILKKYSKQWNHGVTGSVLMLRHIQRRLGKINPRDAAAALSIAVHDKDLHDELLNTGIFPLQISRFPLPCLLLYCDTIEEWARSRFYSPDVRLVDLSISNQNIHCEVSFSQYREARNKLIECEKIQRCISTGDFEFTFSPRVHISRY